MGFIITPPIEEPPLNIRNNNYENVELSNLISNLFDHKGNN